MNRPKDPAIREKLLQAAAQYVLRHGVGGLSLRPMAKDIGTTARMLIHHFGSKEMLVSEVLLAIEQGFARRTEALAGDGHGIAATLQHMWSDVASAEMEPALRSMFEVWGQALVNPGRYGSFLEWVTEPWIDLMRRRFEQSGRTPADASVLATLAVGAFQGLQLVRLTSAKGDRGEQALQVLSQWLESGEPKISHPQELFA